MNIKFSKSVNGSLQIIALNGQQLLNTSLNNISYQLDLSAYATGMYYMVVKPENGQAIATSFSITK
jgi:hypothetical protein